jgi:NAD(P)-dependent dehydrogenase (short-subunit alcohol dehydrogenase family)
VADRAAVESAADRIEAELGPIGLWVNNAMAGVFSEFLSTEAEDFERATFVNYFGAVNGTRAALSRMVPRDAGHVIQIGSALAHRGIPLQAAYCGSKHAIKGFTESVITELGHNDSAVTISMVDMPALNTIQFNWVKSQLPSHPRPVPPIFEPEVGAKAVSDVVRRPRRVTWVGQPTYKTVLGNRFAAPFADWYLARTGYDGQQAPEIMEPMLPTNLYEPVPGDHGARGLFSEDAKNGDLATFAIAHRRAVTAAAGALGAAAAVVAVGLLRRKR